LVQNWAGDEVSLTFQCDDCGMPDPKRPIPDDVFDAWYWGGVEYPDLDDLAAGAAISSALKQVLAGVERMAVERVMRMFGR
jgi:hypothetical protein